MSGIPGTNVAAMVVPFDTADIYATHNDKYGRGGYRVCDTLAERDAITDLRRKAGMWVRCLEDSKIYEMGAGLTNADWVEVSLGSGGVPYDPTLKYFAATALGGHRVVAMNSDGKAEYADQTNAAHINKVLGITTSAVNADEIASIVRGGEVTEPSWSWTVTLPVFLGTNGLLTQTQPSTGFSLIVGFPVATTKLFVSIREPIALI